MKTLKWQFFVGLTFLLIDTILCFIMIYVGHLGTWEFLNNLSALYYLTAISILCGIGIGLIIWSLFTKRFHMEI